MSTLLFFSDDLMFSSKISGAAAQQQKTLKCVSSLAAFKEQLAAASNSNVIVDLSCPAADPAAVVAIVREQPQHGKVVAFGAHVQAGRLAAATTAGCDLVLTRGQFNAQVEQVLASLV